MGPLNGGPLFSRPGWSFPGSVVDLDFRLSRYWGLSPANFVCARASVGYAQYLDNNGLLGTFANNVLRITDRGLLIERSATNLVLRSRDFANAAWVATNVTVAQTSDGADGTPNGAARLTAGAVNATILQSLVLTSAARTFSIWAKRITGSGTVGLCQDGATFTDISGLLNSTSFSRVPLTATQLNPIVGLQLGTSGDAIDVDFAQYEATTAATMPIVTAGASASRATETATAVFSASGPITQYVEVDNFNALAFVNGEVFMITDDGTANNRDYLPRLNGSANVVGSHVAAGAATTTGNLTGSGAGVHKFALTTGFGTSQMAAAHAGVLSTLVSPAAYNPTTFLRLGTDTNPAGSMNGYIRRAAIFPFAMSPEALRILTQ